LKMEAWSTIAVALSFTVRAIADVPPLLLMIAPSPVLMIRDPLRFSIFFGLPICSFLPDPLRPALALPLMAVFTKAATAKHARIILMEVESVMIVEDGYFKLVCKTCEEESRDRKDMKKFALLRYVVMIWCNVKIVM
jgi:hypothetical protein